MQTNDHTPGFKLEDIILLQFEIKEITYIKLF